MGKHQEALETHQKALEIRKSLYGEQHPLIAVSYENIGFSYQDSKEYELELQYQTKALDIREAGYGEIHAETARSIENFAQVKFIEGEDESVLEHAETVLEHAEMALEIKLKVYGEKHTEVASSFLLIAEIKNAMEENEEALVYVRKALEFAKPNGKIRHLKIAADSLKMLGLLLTLMDLPEEGIESFLEGIQIEATIYGETSPLLLRSLNRLGMIYQCMDQNNQALNCFVKALDINKLNDGEKSRSVLDSYNKIVTFLFIDLKAYESSIEFILKAIELQTFFDGEIHEMNKSRFLMLGECYKNLSEYQKAIDAYLKCADITKAMDGETNVFYEELFYSIGILYLEKDENQNALNALFKSLKLHLSLHENPVSQAARLYDRIADIFMKLKDYKTANKYYLKARTVYRFLAREDRKLSQLARLMTLKMDPSLPFLDSLQKDRYDAI